MRQVADSGRLPAPAIALFGRRRLGEAVPQEQMTEEQVRRLVVTLRDVAQALSKADPKLKARLYEELGVEVSYDPHRHVIGLSAGPCVTERVGGGT